MSAEEQIKSRRFYDNENESGWDRIKSLYKDVFNGVVRFECNFVFDSFVYSFIGGAMWRSLFGSNEIMREFHVRHNASVFMGKRDAKKQILWFTIERLFNRGVSFGGKCAALCGACSFLAVHSFVYRKELSILDLSACTGIAFAITRYNRGLKAISSAFVIGLLSGLLSATTFKAVIWASNTSIKDWLDERNQNLKRGLVIEVEQDVAK